MAEVFIHKQEDLEKALRNFKLKCKREGILKECREREFYVKDSQKRRMSAKKKK